MFKELDGYLKNLSKKVDALEEIIENNNKKINDKLDKLIAMFECDCQLDPNREIPTELEMKKILDEVSGTKEQERELVINNDIPSVAYTLDDAILDRDLGNIVNVELLSDEDRVKFLDEECKGITGISVEKAESIRQEPQDTIPGLFLVADMFKANKEFFKRPLVEEAEMMTIIVNFLKEITAEGLVALDDISKSNTLKNILTKEQEKIKEFFEMDGFDFAESIVVEDFHKYFFVPFMKFYDSEIDKITSNVMEELDKMEPVIKNGEVINLVTEKTELSLLDFHGDVESKTKDEIELAINQRTVVKGEDDTEELYMGNKTFKLTENFIEVNGEKLYEIIYLKDFKYTVGETTMAIMSGVVGGHVSKKAFIQEEVTIYPGAQIPQYCVLTKGSIVTAPIPPFTKNFKEGLFINEVSVLDLDKTPYALNEDRISI